METLRNSIKDYKFINGNKYRKLASLVAIDEYTLPEDVEAPAPAFVTREGPGRAYKLYIDKSVPEAIEMFTLHELGHVLFQHLRYEDITKTNIKERVIANWDNLKKFIDNDIEAEDAELSDATIHLILNYAEDMQVNSTIFTAEEKDIVNNVISYFQLSKLPKEAQETALSLLPEGTPYTSAVFPSDFGFADGLNWFSYAELILNNPEKFFNDFKNQQNSKDGKEGKDGNNSEGAGEGSGKAKASDIMKKSSSSDTSEKLEKEAKAKGLDKSSEKSKEGNSSSSSEGKNDVEKSNSSELEEEVVSGTRRGNRGGNSSNKQVSGTYTEFEDVKKFILDHAIMENKGGLHSDMLYNYNRGKSGNVILPKTREKVAFNHENVYLLIDCSGSVPENVVGKMTATCRDVSRRLGSGSRAIYWNTELISDKSLKNVEDHFYTGGGNDLAEGIEYISKKYLRRDRTGILFIISDFEDDNELMGKAAKGIQNIFGVKWNYENWGEVPDDILKINYPKMKWCNYTIPSEW